MTTLIHVIIVKGARKMKNEERKKVILKYMQEECNKVKKFYSFEKTNPYNPYNRDILFWIRRIRNGCGYLVPEEERRIVVHGKHYKKDEDGNLVLYGDSTIYGWKIPRTQIRYSVNQLVEEGSLFKLHYYGTVYYVLANLAQAFGGR